MRIIFYSYTKIVILIVIIVMLLYIYDVFNKLSSFILYMTSISNHFGMQVRIKKNYQHIILIFLIISLVLVRAVVIEACLFPVCTYQWQQICRPFSLIIYWRGQLKKRQGLGKEADKVAAARNITQTRGHHHQRHHMRGSAEREESTFKNPCFKVNKTNKKAVAHTAGISMTRASVI